ncbi:MAG: queuosine salvage family protein [Chloroflexia bacterium]
MDASPHQSRRPTARPRAGRAPRGDALLPRRGTLSRTSRPFYKQAQIFALADLTLAFNGTGLGAFTDLDRLTIFADSLVPARPPRGRPAPLRRRPRRADRLGQPLAANSPEEVEIRAAAVHTAELLVAACAAHGHPTTARELDYLLWNRGLAPIYRETPRHRTRTTAY